MKRSCILTYHSLDNSGSVISIPPKVFCDQMDWLAESGAPVVPLKAVRDTPGAVSITFDDGFQSFAEHAFPVLRRYGFPATVFAVSDYCGRRNDWPSQPRNNGIPILDLMSWSDLEEIARAGIEIGSHSATHARLPLLRPAEAERELAASRVAIEDRLSRPVTTFCYPYGESSPALRAAVGRYFERACSTELAFLTRHSDPAALPRIDVYYLRSPFWFRQWRSFLGNVYLGARAALRGVRRALRA